MTQEPVSAVSNKSNTTNEAIVGIHSNLQSGVQIELIDTPGITKRYKHSAHYVTKAWENLNRSNMVLVMVDSVKMMEDSTKEAIKRLNTIKINKKDLEETMKI